jgi:uncharacterized protein YndB with AHSA1/START domain
MKVFKWIAIVIGTLVAVFFVGAALMPPAFKVERTATINAPAEKIFPLIADPRAWSKWGVWVKREPTLKMAYSGAATGVGAKWEWEGKDGKGAMEFTAVEPGKSLVYAISFPDIGMRSMGRLTLAPEGTATRVTWVAEGDVGKNPLIRWFVPFLDGMLGADFAAGLAGLKVLAETK